MTDINSNTAELFALTARLDAKDRQLTIMLEDAESGLPLDESRYDQIEDEWVALFLEREAAARVSAQRPLQRFLNLLI